MAKRWSQSRLANLIGVQRQAIYDIEAGRYLPNTLVALRLAKHLECSVEDLFSSDSLLEKQPITLVDNDPNYCVRVAAARVRGKLIGVGLGGKHCLNDGLRAADGLMDPVSNDVQLLCSSDQVNKAVLLLGCDPAFSILASHLTRIEPGARILCRFSSSHDALVNLSKGLAHLSGTHLHNTGHLEANVEMVKQLYPGFHGKVIAFSTLEEGFITAPGNPLGIRSVTDLAEMKARLINREPGAALRVLLDDELLKASIPASEINGYSNEVSTHLEGALMVGSNSADIALGFRTIADAFNLGFVPIAEVRCDVVIPHDMFDHPVIKIILDIMSSRVFRAELDSIPGYDPRYTGKVIASL